MDKYYRIINVDYKNTRGGYVKFHLDVNPVRLGLVVVVLTVLATVAYYYYFGV